MPETPHNNESLQNDLENHVKKVRKILKEGTGLTIGDLYMVVSRLKAMTNAIAKKEGKPVEVGIFTGKVSATQKQSDTSNIRNPVFLILDDCHTDLARISLSRKNENDSATPNNELIISTTDYPKIQNVLKNIDLALDTSFIGFIKRSLYKKRG